MANRLANTLVGTLVRALTSGSVAGLATTAAVAVAGKCEAGSALGPVNATSHILWGDAAGRQDKASLKYTVPGFLLNHFSAVFWASFYEAWFSRRGTPRGATKTLMKPVLGAVVVSAGAYLTDYYLVPKRFTPGWEKRLSGRSLAATYGMLALGLMATDLFNAARRK
ncbi:hypothetical protein [Noviherbaspirillum pedocola]|uniref:DUF1440 domain-containing protein n=1 Tax=Noviherbaspirillum pedocola TaxID=2801341 RepID=A0A934W520_9BURK|nr:hypothetical protein [Noviherbaspirillum pedocola]MBK4734472.1 hypothetical protein [Noviherbaspirillum pedocola]